MTKHAGSKKMKHKLVRLAIGVPTAFNALSAIGGGIDLLAGTYQDGVLIEAGRGAEFPLEALHNTPFSDYRIPALLLAVASAEVRSSPLCWSSQAATRASSRLQWRDSSWPDGLSERS